jgi:hypothetical protein
MEAAHRWMKRNLNVYRSATGWQPVVQLSQPVTFFPRVHARHTRTSNFDFQPRANLRFQQIQRKTRAAHSLPFKPQEAAIRTGRLKALGPRRSSQDDKANQEKKE